MRSFRCSPTHPRTTSRSRSPRTVSHLVASLSSSHARIVGVGIKMSGWVWLATLVSAAAYVAWWLLYACGRPEITGRRSAFNELVRARCSLLSGVYYPTFWVFSNHLHVCVFCLGLGGRSLD